jgi:ribonuclease HIII
MFGAKDRYDLYQKLKALLQKNGFIVNPYRDIDYGLQFLLSFGNESELLRLYDGKKGLRLDYSQIKSQAFLSAIQTVLSETEARSKPMQQIVPSGEKDVESLDSQSDPDDLIGVDESGKGDYFGPLVVASVRINDETREKLAGLNIQDSKKLSPKAIDELAGYIINSCQHTVIIIGNESYNTVYEKFQNLNHILAWAHMKAIEDNLKQGHCPNVLCDQFAAPSLLKNALRAKRLNVTLYQRPRAEANLAVACASILARYYFVDQLNRMSSAYNSLFPKGSTKKVVEFAQAFVDQHGLEEIRAVAKWHFKITNQLILS